MSGPSNRPQKSHQSGKPKSPKYIPTPKRLRTSIRFDTINPSDYLKYDFRMACEDCSHFDGEACSLGYASKWHRRDFQIKSYELSGKIALCRFMEID